jgi:hypothetical protein
MPKVITEEPERPKLLSRETVHHPDGTIEVIEKFEPPRDWREVVADLERLERQLRRGT